MSEQQFQGTLASGGSFIATSRGIRILDPAGNELASFGREVISGINREGQVVTVERHADTIITITAGSITDAVGLEQFVRDSILAAPSPADQPGTPPLAFDAFDDDTPDEPRPQIISRLDPSFYPEAERPPHDLPEPVSTTPPESQGYPPPPETPDRPETPGTPPPTTTPPMADSPPEEGRGRPIWLWGCLGCGGLIILAVICTGILLATGEIDVDEITGDDDATPTPFIIVATEPDDDATPTAAGSGDQPTPTTGETDEEPATAPPAGEVMGVDDSGTLSGMQLTYLGSRTDTGGIFPPDAGNEYLILRFRVENTTAEATFVSTLLQFQLHNEAGEEFELGLFADIEEVLDVEIPAGETIEGEVAFEVPEGNEGYRVTYDDLITQSSLIWAVE